MSISDILTHTPIWVWLLLGYLLLRGIRALRAREMTVQRMLVLPILFLVWGVWSVFAELSNWPVALVAFAMLLGAGLPVGWLLGLHLPPAHFDRSTGLISRPGSPQTLILVTLGFSLKYILTVYLAYEPALASEANTCALFGGISGGIDGIFWGGTALQMTQAFRRLEQVAAKS